MKLTRYLLPVLFTATLRAAELKEQFQWKNILSPVIFRGDSVTAYRDPTAVYHDGWLHLFFTLSKIEPDGNAFSYIAWSKSHDLVNWTTPKVFTPRDLSLNYGNPGSIVRVGEEWVLCLQTYPRPNEEKYGNESDRLWIMRSKDLENWSRPEMLRVKGPEVLMENMGRMIDPYLFRDKDDPSKLWCFYKQNGVSMSWSRDLKNWTYAGRVAGGENSCVIVDGSEYVLFHSPENGIGIKRSTDLKSWHDEEVLKLGQKDWPWAQGRLTAGFVLDLRNDFFVGKALMFFHGSDFPETDSRGGFDHFASIGLAWSDDLKTWHWPGQTTNTSNIPGWPKEVKDIHYRSSADGSLQPSLFYAPATTNPVPLLVALHTWSSNYRQPPEPGYANWCIAKGWALLHPNFRGPNNQPEAMGSDKAVQDILDALAYAKSHANIDPNRIYLMGGSGGGYACLLMAGRAPDVWAGVSAWVPIFDLMDWHRECTLAKRAYAQMMEKACGGAPGSSRAVDQQYRLRSASSYLARASGVPLDLNTGIHDGHRGSVPVSQTLNAFNILARPENQLSPQDIAYLTEKEAIPPHLSDQAADDFLYGQKSVLLRRINGNTRLTVFDGGHEFVLEAGLHWLALQRKGQPAKWKVPASEAPILERSATEVGK